MENSHTQFRKKKTLSKSQTRNGQSTLNKIYMTTQNAKDSHQTIQYTEQSTQNEPTISPQPSTIKSVLQNLIQSQQSNKGSAYMKKRFNRNRAGTFVGIQNVSMSYQTSQNAKMSFFGPPNESGSPLPMAAQDLQIQDDDLEVILSPKITGHNRNLTIENSFQPQNTVQRLRKKVCPTTNQSPKVQSRDGGLNKSAMTMIPCVKKNLQQNSRNNRSILPKQIKTPQDGELQKPYPIMMFAFQQSDFDQESSPTYNHQGEITNVQSGTANMTNITSAQDLPSSQVSTFLNFRNVGKRDKPVLQQFTHDDQGEERNNIYDFYNEQAKSPTVEHNMERLVQTSKVLPENNFLKNINGHVRVNEKEQKEFLKSFNMNPQFVKSPRSASQTKTASGVQRSQNFKSSQKIQLYMPTSPKTHLQKLLQMDDFSSHVQGISPTNTAIASEQKQISRMESKMSNFQGTSKSKNRLQSSHLKTQKFISRGQSQTTTFKSQDSTKNTINRVTVGQSVKFDRNIKLYQFGNIFKKDHKILDTIKNSRGTDQDQLINHNEQVSKSQNMQPKYTYNSKSKSNFQNSPVESQNLENLINPRLNFKINSSLGVKQEQIKMEDNDKINHYQTMVLPISQKQTLCLNIVEEKEKQSQQSNSQQTSNQLKSQKTYTQKQSNTNTNNDQQQSYETSALDQTLSNYQQQYSSQFWQQNMSKTSEQFNLYNQMKKIVKPKISQVIQANVQTHVQQESVNEEDEVDGDGILNIFSDQAANKQKIALDIRNQEFPKNYIFREQRDFQKRINIPQFILKLEDKQLQPKLKELQNAPCIPKHELASFLQKIKSIKPHKPILNQDEVNKLIEEADQLISQNKHQIEDAQHISGQPFHKMDSINIPPFILKLEDKQLQQKLKELLTGPCIPKHELAGFLQKIKSIKQYKPTLNQDEVNKQIEEVDQLISQNKQKDNDMDSIKINKLIDEFNVKREGHCEDKIKEYNNTKAAYDKLCQLAYIMIHNQKQKNVLQKVVADDSVQQTVKQMIKFSKRDPIFRISLQTANPQVRTFLSQVVVDLNHENENEKAKIQETYDQAKIQEINQINSKQCLSVVSPTLYHEHTVMEKQSMLVRSLSQTSNSVSSDSSQQPHSKKSSDNEIVNPEPISPTSPLQRQQKFKYKNLGKKQRSISITINQINQIDKEMPGDKTPIHQLANKIKENYTPIKSYRKFKGEKSPNKTYLGSPMEAVPENIKNKCTTSKNVAAFVDKNLLISQFNNDALNPVKIINRPKRIVRLGSNLTKLGSNRTKLVRVGQKNKTPPKGNYYAPHLIKFRTIVCRHFITVPLETMMKMKINLDMSLLPDLGKEKIENYSVFDQMLHLKLEPFKIAFNTCFPKQMTLGKKLQEISKNMFVNDFLYDMLGESTIKHQNVLRDYFRLNDVDFDDGVKDNNLMAIMETEQINLDNLFTKNVEKAYFYDQVKSVRTKEFKYEDMEGNPWQDIYDNEKRQAIANYYQTLIEKMETVKPFFFFQPKILYITQQRISLQQSLALMNYLGEIKDVPGKKVYRLVVDSCAMTDDVFANILDGIISQQKIIKGKIRIQYLQSMIYSHNSIGIKSMTRLMKLVPNMVELILNNVTFVGSRQNDVDISQQDILQNILLSTQSSRMMKFKMSSINLKYTGSMYTRIICDTVQISKNMIFLDLSWACLPPVDLALISKTLSMEAWQLRNLNLSYNKLDFDSSREARKNSELFISNMEKFFWEALFINHINFCGMALKEEQLCRLLDLFAGCQFILGIHLSDNNIAPSSNNISSQNVDTKQTDYFKDIMKTFLIRPDYLAAINRNDIELPIKMQTKFATVEQFLDRKLISHNTDLTRPEPCLKQSLFKKIDYVKVLKQYFTLKPEQEDYDLVQEGTNQKLLKNQKDHVLIAKEAKVLDTYKLINKTLVMNGVGRLENNPDDFIVLTRRLNHPELIFNQQIGLDLQIGDFFRKDADQRWQLSCSGECYICEKHSYTTIFYERSLMKNMNKGLTQIFDEQIIKSLKDDFHSNINHYKSLTPIICGTIIRKAQKQGAFDRKLKMLQAPLFALLQICQNDEYITKAGQQTYDIKMGIQKFLKLETQKLYDQLKFADKLKGWEHLIKDKCLNNELMDVKTINIPDLKKNQDEEKNIYIFAGFLKPGYHQCLIYDPLHNTAFCRDFMVNLNLREDIYPEYPLVEGSKMRRGIKNVFEHWKEESDLQIQKSFDIDRKRTQNFSVKYLAISDPKEQELCLNFLFLKNREMYAYYRTLQVRSQKYPKIDFETFYDFTEETEAFAYQFKNRKTVLTRAIMENVFLATIRKDPSLDTIGKKRSFQRCELFELVLRMCYQWIIEQHTVQSIIQGHQKMSVNLVEFFDIYIDPYYQSSNIFVHRNQIRDSKHLNKLLYDNSSGLRLIYEKSKNELNLFTIESAFEIMQPLKHDELIIKDQKIVECFLFSQMTVIDETTVNKLRKYEYLHYYEFLDMLCRVAIVGITMEDLVEYKVSLLLEIIYKYQYRIKDMNPQDNQLYGVDESFRHDIHV